MKEAIKYKRRVLVIALMIINIIFISSQGNCLNNEGEQTITIVHTNDIHGRANYEKDSKIIGFAKLKTIIKNEAPDIVVDAGDLYHGYSFATVEEGESIAKIVKNIGYDAMAVGNHDWNYGQDQLKKLEAISGIPIVSSNVSMENGGKFFDKDYVIKEVKGLKIGMFGIIDPNIYTATSPSKLKGIKYDDPYQAAQTTVRTLKGQGCDVVICLAHYTNLEEFVNNVQGIDVVIAGHMHAILNQEINNTLIVETDGYFKNVGILKMTYSNKEHKILNKDEQMIPCDKAVDIQEDEYIKNMINEINKNQSVELKKAVGKAPVDLVGEKLIVRCKETNLGHVITDAYLHETGADISFENGGGIRKTIKAGEITKKDIVDVMPFGNVVVTKKLTGKQIIDCLEISIDLGIKNAQAYAEGDSKKWLPNDGSYMHVGGMKVTYDSSSEYGSRTKNVLIGKDPIDKDKMYTVASNSYIINNLDYPPLAAAEEVGQFAVGDEVLAKYIKDIGVEQSLKGVRMLDVASAEDIKIKKEPVQTGENAGIIIILGFTILFSGLFITKETAHISVN